MKLQLKSIKLNWTIASNSSVPRTVFIEMICVIYDKVVELEGLELAQTGGGLKSLS